MAGLTCLKAIIKQIGDVKDAKNNMNPQRALCIAFLDSHPLEKYDWYIKKMEKIICGFYGERIREALDCQMTEYTTKYLIAWGIVIVVLVVLYTRE